VGTSNNRLFGRVGGVGGSLKAALGVFHAIVIAMSAMFLILPSVWTHACP